MTVAKFPPKGVRGQGSAFAGIAFGVDAQSYVRAANETVVTCLQIESREGVENVEEICAVEDVGEYCDSRFGLETRYLYDD